MITGRIKEINKTLTNMNDSCCFYRKNKVRKHKLILYEMVNTEYTIKMYKTHDFFYIFIHTQSHRELFQFWMGGSTLPLHLEVHFSSVSETRIRIRIRWVQSSKVMKHFGWKVTKLGTCPVKETFHVGCSQTVIILLPLYFKLRHKS